MSRNHPKNQHFMENLLISWVNWLIGVSFILVVLISNILGYNTQIADK